MSTLDDWTDTAREAVTCRGRSCRAEDTPQAAASKRGQ
jgi:hypothetical protein